MKVAELRKRYRVGNVSDKVKDYMTMYVCAVAARRGMFDVDANCIIEDYLDTQLEFTYPTGPWLHFVPSGFVEFTEEALDILEEGN